MTRGTTKGNVRGSSADRLRRRQWLVETFRADVDVIGWSVYSSRGPHEIEPGKGIPACRCYRCGDLLTVDTVSPDRIIPGCMGGTYRRDNIRPACLPCQEVTGGRLGASRRKVAPDSTRV